jgi:hypothetical protein
MPKISLNLRKEPTDVAPTSNTTFNAPGNFLPRYGKTEFLVGGKGAPGNATTGGNYAGTNAPTGGNYAGTNAPSGGNYAYTNSPTPGNISGYSPAGVTWYKYQEDNAYFSPGYTSYNDYTNSPFAGFLFELDYPTVNPSGYFTAYGDPRYDPQGATYTVAYANKFTQYGYNNTPTYGVPNPYMYGNYYQAYALKQYFPGGAIYNPTTPGNAVYTPISPGYAYYNPTVPGNAYYNPTVPGNAGTPFSLGGVYFQGGAADGVAPTVSPTSSTLVYNGPSGITVTVPSGGYVQITSKATNTY